MNPVTWVTLLLFRQKKKEKRDMKRKKHIGVNEIKSVGEARFGLWRQ